MPPRLLDWMLRGDNTRPALPTKTLLELLSPGTTTDELLADYEDLQREDILATLEFAARLCQVKIWLHPQSQT